MPKMVSNDANTSFCTFPILQCPYVREMPGDGSRCSHRGRYKVGTPAAALAAFEIAVGGRSTALAFLQLVGIHRQAHGAARIAPFKARVHKHLVQAFFLGL